jgi:hypothetical protein
MALRDDIVVEVYEDELMPEYKLRVLLGNKGHPLVF